MGKKINKEFYKQIGFAVFIFVLTTAFSKEYFFQSHSELGMFFSSLIALLVSFVLTYFLKGRKFIYNIIVVIIYIIIIISFSYYKRSNVTENNLIATNKNHFKGNWIMQDENLILKLNITDKDIKMIFYPDNKQLIFDYEIEGKKIDLFNDDDVSHFEWEVLKITNDSLVVLERKQVLRFSKEK